MEEDEASDRIGASILEGNACGAGPRFGMLIWFMTNDPIAQGLIESAKRSPEIEQRYGREPFTWRTGTRYETKRRTYRVCFFGELRFDCGQIVVQAPLGGSGQTRASLLVGGLMVDWDAEVKKW